MFALLIGFSGCCAKKSAVVHNPSTQSSLYSSATKVADELLTCPILKENKSTPIVLTSFVNVHEFSESSDFGRLFSETLLSEISKRGFTVIDYRGLRVISQTKDGEFSLVRNSQKIDKYKDALILVGTYGQYNKGLAVNARLLDSNNQIQASANVHIADKELRHLSNINRCDLLGCCELEGCAKPKKAEVKVEKPFCVPIVQDDCSQPGKCCNGPECKK